MKDHGNIQETDGLSCVGSEMQNSADSDTLDRVFGLLSSSRRRSIIRCVYAHQNITKDELIWRVAEDEYGLPREEIDSSERHTIYVSLQQTHLERLEREGVIRRDRDRIMVGPYMDELLFYLRESDETLGDKLKRSISALC